MDEEYFIVSDEEIRREKRLSIVIMLLLPLPCVVYSVWLSRAGYETAAWVYLGLSVVLECLAVLERILLIRGLEGLVLSLLPDRIAIRWVGGSLEIGREEWLGGGTERGFFRGKASGLWFRTPTGIVRIPWFSGARDFVEGLRRGDWIPADTRSFPAVQALIAAALAGFGVGTFLLGFPVAWLGPLLVLSLAGFFLAYPLSHALGPEFRKWDRALVLSVGLMGAALSIAGVVLAVLAGEWKTPPPLPGEPGDGRSLAIFRLGRSRRPEALSALLELTSSSDARDRRDSALALGFRGGPGVLESLRKTSRDEEPWVRRAAVHSLGSVPARASLEILLATLTGDGELFVAREANRSLERLTGRSFHAGLASKLLLETDRRMAIAFWRRVLKDGGMAARDGGTRGRSDPDRLKSFSKRGETTEFPIIYICGLWEAVDRPYSNKTAGPPATDSLAARKQG